MDVCPHWERDQDPVTHFSQGTEQPLDVNDFWQLLTWVRFKPMTQKGEVLLFPISSPWEPSSTALPLKKRSSERKAKGVLGSGAG